MIMRISEIVHGWLGWCPQARALPRQPPLLNDEIVRGASAQKERIPERTGWLQRYRNQVLLLAVSLTFAAIPAVAFFQSDDLTRLMMYVGTITGLGFLAFFGPWLWNSLGMLAKGMTIKTEPREYLILFVIAGSIPLWYIFLVAGMLTVISFAGALAFPAFATGFAFIPWYVLVLIFLWEQRTGCTLMFDKKTRSFTAVRCS
jgi:Protein of unknown function (DUF1673).